MISYPKNTTKRLIKFIEFIEPNATDFRNSTFRSQYSVYIQQTVKRVNSAVFCERENSQASE